jgi:hypothetical protein
MFKNVAADMLGLSDIGAVIKPADYDKVDADDYVLREEGERIYFLIKSKSDEYCFTNLGLVHLDGTSATSKRRMLRRFPYLYHQLSDVRLETAGTVDLDIEIKFTLGNQSYSIDVGKQYMPELKKLYKALVKIASIQHENSLYLQYAQTSLNTAATSLGRSSHGSPADEQFQKINQYVFTWLQNTHKNFARQDFGEVFARYGVES